MDDRLERWMDGYIKAWATGDPEDIAALFTAEAVYDTQTAGGEWHGIDEIVANWQEIGDEPENWEFEWTPMIEAPELAIVTGRTRYLDPPTSYRNLFVIRFEGDRCYDFTEWYIEEEA